MKKPKIASSQPVPVTLKEGEVKYWCACGESKSQPYCDGSHQGTDFEPCAFSAKGDGEVWLCMCKQTKTPPYCDGTHHNLED
jgi:CDGSH-type Zn-finger protein